MALDASCREVEEKLGPFSGISLKLEWLRDHVLRLINRQRAYWDLVQEVELFHVRGHIRHYYLTAIGCIDQKFGRHSFLLVTVSSAILTCVSMRDHKVLLEADRNIFNLFLENDKIGTSSDR
jgi:hypothetical protein